MMPRTGNSATGYALRSIPRARNAQQRLNRRISQTGNSLHLSTVAKSKGSYPSWVKIESAGWVRIQSARTAKAPFQSQQRAERSRSSKMRGSLRNWDSGCTISRKAVTRPTPTTCEFCQACCPTFAMKFHASRSDDKYPKFAPRCRRI
jgi:hypothetical protein